MNDTVVLPNVIVDIPKSPVTYTSDISVSDFNSTQHHSPSDSTMSPIPPIISVPFADSTPPTDLAPPTLIPIHMTNSANTSHVSNSVDVPLAPISSLPPPRRSSRNQKPPSYLENYHCQLALNSTLKPILSTLTDSHIDGVVYPISSSLSLL